jgi:hypothetical protein
VFKPEGLLENLRLIDLTYYYVHIYLFFRSPGSKGGDILPTSLAFAEGTVTAVQSALNRRQLQIHDLQVHYEISIQCRRHDDINVYIYKLDQAWFVKGTTATCQKAMRQS